MPRQLQLKIPATYMRGGTSKGVFFKLEDLPAEAQVPGAARDALLMRVIGSPDPYGKQTDGMGGATSSTSKTVIISKSAVPDHDVDYLYGQVAIEQAFVDWSGNCGNLSSAVGPFAITNGLVEAARLPRDGIATIRIWQANIGKTILAHVPMRDGQVQELGDFELDGVTFPAAEIELEFLDPPRVVRGDHDQFRHPDRVPESGSAWTERHRIAGRHQQRCRPAREARNHSRACGIAHGRDQGRERSGDAPAHAEDRVRRAADGLHRIQRQAH